jgi:hypothetical protein
MNVEYINYLEAYPNLERALKEGANMRCFLSGNNLRVVVVKNDDNDVTYGEYPYFPGALAHAEEDFGLTYDQQYRGENAKHPYYNIGASIPPPYDAFDVYLRGGSTLNIFYCEHWNKIVCSSNITMGRVIYGTSDTLLCAIVDCLLFGYNRAEEETTFLKRVHEKDF